MPRSRHWSPRAPGTPGACIGLEELSDSEHQAALFALAFPDFGLEGSLVLVDEPDLHIHAAHRVRFLHALVGLGRDNQIIAATGSAEIVAAASAGQVRVCLNHGRYLLDISGGQEKCEATGPQGHELSGEVPNSSDASLDRAVSVATMTYDGQQQTIYVDGDVKFTGGRERTTCAISFSQMSFSPACAVPSHQVSDSGPHGLNVGASVRNQEVLAAGHRPAAAAGAPPNFRQHPGAGAGPRSADRKPQKHRRRAHADASARLDPSWDARRVATGLRPRLLTSRHRASSRSAC